ncbi:MULTISPECIES: hypothetical protein [Agrobacterium tumefaciens complex]|jgi:hypothetical protein|uniref:Transmembrane protein n=1 Tax=Agrobacterium genomosp. 13 str. CFBP 6927 TaxID=1183428 RepID=A0ABP2BGG2_9HYPH|nr:MULTISPECIES: hypothetical protein [Agrobacterium tumefaciens complex]TQN63500.1 hypothetical protein FLX27_02590 [Agrobacterium tumefaciens]UXS32059.1 hypothetical protein FY152_08140 [Agrobacterium tumefaciens]CDN94220.1 hypothetical protein BN949_03387 [Agrobacterium tumefaciens]CUX24042.1 hypothetical protein AGR13a_Cc240017 [Agrobacterium genomosp. 13 str. CFBP 6927]
MNQPLGLYYRLQAELRRRVMSDKTNPRVPPIRRRASTDVSMFFRLLAVVGGLLLAVSLIMQSVQ